MTTVAEAMLAPAVEIGPDATLQQASAEMLAAGTHAALLVRHRRLQGIVSADDIAAAMAAGVDVTRGRAAELAHAVVVARADEPLPEAHERMRDAQQDLAAVVDRHNRPVGLLRAAD